MSKTILVTGGAGYIGSHTIVKLVENGYTPIILDDFSNSDKLVLERLETITNQSIKLVEGSILDELKLADLFDLHPIEGVIHFAAFKAVGESVSEPLKYYENNITGLINILKICNLRNVSNFVFSSSCTVYGEPKGVTNVSESSLKQLPNSPYGFTKWMGEQILEDLSKVGDFWKIMALRYFNPIGAHPSGLIGELPLGKPNNLLPFITQTAKGKWEKLTVFGNDYPTTDGTCIRDYLHVMDLADAHVSALNYLFEQQSSGLEYVNIGTGKGTSVLEMIQLFEKVTGLKLPYEIGPKRAGDVTEIFAVADKAKKLLNWEAQLSIEQAIIDAWNWEQKLEKLT
jgi:UDP-glucose 4-epimerase